MCNTLVSVVHECDLEGDVISTTKGGKEQPWPLFLLLSALTSVGQR
jgi:hypothetical protein